MATYNLHYFPIKGRAEPIRLILEYVQVWLLLLVCFIFLTLFDSYRGCFISNSIKKIICGLVSLWGIGVNKENLALEVLLVMLLAK
jgi:hypothetical protein